MKKELKLSENALKLLKHMEESNGVTEFMLTENQEWIKSALEELKPTGLIEYIRPLGWFIKEDDDNE